MTGDPSPSLGLGMDEVTSKIAYAYAKQSAFALLAVVVLIVAATGLWSALVPVRSALGAIPLAVGWAFAVVAAALVLGRVAREHNLERVNRPSRRLLAMSLGVLIVATLASGILGRPDASELALPLVGVAVLAVGLASYPFPTRRGSTVLYPPEAVRELANGRAAGLAAGLLTTELGVRLVLGGSFPNGPVPVPFAGAVLALAPPLVALLLYLYLPTGRSRVRLVELWLGVSFLLEVALLLLAPFRGAGGLTLLPPLGTILGAFGLHAFASARINRGKGIVGRRG